MTAQYTAPLPTFSAVSNAQGGTLAQDSGRSFEQGVQKIDTPFSRNARRSTPGRRGERLDRDCRASANRF
jgi:hypothetical protein